MKNFFFTQHLLNTLILSVLSCYSIFFEKFSSFFVANRTFIATKGQMFKKAYR